MLYSHNTSHSHLSPLPLQNSATSSCQPRATGSPAWLPTNSPEDSTTQLLSRSWSQENPDPSPPPTLPEKGHFPSLKYSLVQSVATNGYGSKKRYASSRGPDVWNAGVAQITSNEFYLFRKVWIMDQGHGSPVGPQYGSGAYILSSQIQETHPFHSKHISCPSKSSLASIHLPA